ncbi:MAG: aldehyde dehydrogenase [Oscillospiraceae bacterium]|nr:aldehyde dehydrogenase [Oscillospiraceae bacterium]
MNDYSDLMKKQRDFFASGKTKDYRYRITALKALEESMKHYEGEINSALKADLNKAAMETYISEYGISLQHITHSMHNLKKWMRPKRRAAGINTFPGIAYEMPEPYGIALIMSPWNYPIQLTMCALIGAVSAGNCCVVKPSAYTPASSAVIAKIIERAFPREYVAVVLGGRAENQQLLEQRFDYIFFTGSVGVGKQVMENAAKNLTPVTLELGGKSPCIVTEDADVEKAAKSIAFGKLLNSGQTCVAPDYVLVDRALMGRFCTEVSVQFRKMIGDALMNEDYPRIVNEKHFERISALFEGATVFSGGRLDRDRLRIEPTVLVDVTETSPVMEEEIFGPLLPVIPYDTLDEAENFVLNGEKPLALYLFTSSRKTEKRVLNKLSFGGGCINDTIVHLMTSGLGFGGVGFSGMGRYHGIHSFETFSHIKGIYRKSALIDLPLRYHPYRQSYYSLARKLMK